MSNNWYEKRKINQSHVLYERLTNKLLNQKFNILKEMKGDDLVKRLRDAVTNTGGVPVSRITPEVFLRDLDAVIANPANTITNIMMAEKLKMLLSNNKKAQLWLDAHAQAVANGDAGAVSRLFQDPEPYLRTQYAVDDFSKIGREPELTSSTQRAPKSSQETTGKYAIDVPQNVTSRSLEQIEDLVQDVASSKVYYDQIKGTAGSKIKKLYKIHTNNDTKPLDQAEFYTALNKLLTDAGAPKKYDMGELTLIFAEEIAAAMPYGKRTQAWIDLTNQLGLTVAGLPARAINTVADGATESSFVKKAIAAVLGVGALGFGAYQGYEFYYEDIRTFDREKCYGYLTSGLKNEDMQRLPEFGNCSVLAKKILLSTPTDEKGIVAKRKFKDLLATDPLLKQYVEGVESQIKASKPAAPSAAAEKTTELTWQNAPNGSTAKFVDQGSKWYVYKEEGSWYYKKDNSKMDDADLKGITEIIPPKK